MRPLPAQGVLPAALAMGAGAVAAGMGLLGLATRALGGPEQPPVPPDLGPLPPTAATALILAGAGLLILAPPDPGRLRRVCGRLLGAGAAGVGLAAILGLVGASAPAAGSALALAGLALAGFAPAVPRRWNPTAVLAPAAAVLAVVTLLSYALQRGTLPTAPVALPVLSAAGVLLLAAGTMVARPADAPLRPLLRRGPGGTLARRLTPALVLLPFGIALVSGLAVRAGLRQPAIAVALSTVVLVLSIGLVVGATARTLDRVDAQHRRAFEDLADDRDFAAALIQSLNEGVVVLDRDLRVIEVNSRWCRLVGRRREDLIGQLPPYSWEVEGAPPEGVDRLVRDSTGAIVPVLATMAPVLDEHGQPRAFLASYVDIAERRRVENVLAERANQLELANAQLSDTNRALQEAAGFKSDLMSMVSHEVSQPLSSVASLAELLVADWPDLPDEVRLELATKIDKNTRRLTGMINDMLLLFRLDAGAVSARRESVPIGEVVETVTDALPGGGSDIITSINPDLCALVDRGHLWQVLASLVANAAKYGEPPIEIACERRADGVIITVRDHGGGIPEEFVPRLFDRFTRARPGGAQARGSGLGLFIVRHLIEANGGTIWYERAEPRGARLVVRLQPAALPATAPENAAVS